MTFLRSAFSRLSKKSAPVVATNMSIDSWCHQLRAKPTRLVRKIEMCTALAAGQDACGATVDKTHLHTMLRVYLVPAPSSGSCDPDGGAPEDVLFVERVLSTGGAHHAVTPIREALSTGGTLFHPEVHDRICAIADGGGPAAGSESLARRLEVERTVVFGSVTTGSSRRQGRLTLAQFAQILEFVSRVTALICAGGGDCKFQSRSFAFTCLAALTPSLPPPTPPAGRSGEGDRVGINAKCCGSNLVDDSVFESGAEMFLEQVPWTVRDRQSTQALRLMVALKDPPPERTTAVLCR